MQDNTYIGIIVPKCDSCGRGEGESFYATFRQDETSILACLSPSFNELNGKRTADAGWIIDGWINTLLAKPLKYARPVGKKRYGLWPEYGRVIDLLISLQAEASEVKGFLKVTHHESPL
jgi:hypothetical protein